MKGGNFNEQGSSRGTAGGLSPWGVKSSNHKNMTVFSIGDFITS